MPCVKDSSFAIFLAACSKQRLPLIPRLKEGGRGGGPFWRFCGKSIIDKESRVKRCLTQAVQAGPFASQLRVSQLNTFSDAACHCSTRQKHSRAQAGAAPAPAGSVTAQLLAALGLSQASASDEATTRLGIARRDSVDPESGVQRS